jgi:hypothetical protein
MAFATLTSVLSLFSASVAGLLGAAAGIFFSGM